MNQEPETPAEVLTAEPVERTEWQEVVNMAKTMLLVHDARLYGLIRGGPVVNAERCIYILAQGAAREIFPQEGEVDRFVGELAGGVPA